MFHFKEWGPWRVTYSSLVRKGTRDLGILRTSVLMPCYLDFDCLHFTCVLFNAELYFYRTLLLKRPWPLEGMWHTNHVPGSPCIQFVLEQLWILPAVLVSLHWMQRSIEVNAPFSECPRRNHPLNSTVFYPFSWAQCNLQVDMNNWIFLY